MRRDGPPPRFEKLLARILPEGERGDAVLGDLEEEYRARARRAPRLAGVWYGLQALALVPRAALLDRRRRRTPGERSMSSGFRDLKLALRNLTRQPVYTGVAAVTLALGIGANTAVFSMVDALVLRPFPIPDVERLAMLWESVPVRGELRGAVAPANFLDWKDRTESFEELVAFDWWDVNLTGTGEPERLQGTLVSPRFFETLGVSTSIGRTLLEDENDFDAKTVVLSRAFFQRRFAGDPALVGQTIVLNGERYDVVGVARDDFDYPYGTDVWAPLWLGPEVAADRSSRYLEVIGKLRRGVSLDDARAELALVVAGLEREHPETNEGREVHVMALARAVVDVGMPAFLVTWQATSLFVLLIACVNVANLVLARGIDRRKELSLQQALGASRGRIVRALLTENLVLSLTGAVLALPLAWLGLELLVTSLPAHIQRFVVGWRQIDLDPRVVGFAAVVSIAATLVFGLVPALRASRPELTAALREGGRGSSESAARRHARTLLVTGEVALALMLLVASGLSVRGAIRLANAEQGYEPDGVMTMEVSLPEQKYDSDEKALQFFEAVLREVREIGGVVSADVSNILPSSGSNFSLSVEIEGRPVPNESQRPTAHFRVVTPGYLDTLGIPLHRGRPLGGEDRAGARPVAVVSELFAERSWPAEDALGKRFRIGTKPDGPWWTVVGITGDVMHDWFLREPQPTVYVPLAQRPRRGAHFVVRTVGEPEAITPAVRDRIRNVDADLPVFTVRSMQALLHERMIGLRYAAGVMAVLGGIALVLSAVGIYGLVAYAVSRRTHEIGVRVALGATRGDVLRITVGQVARVTVAGLALGLGLAYAAGRLMESSLFGIVELEPSTFAGLTLVLGSVSLVAGVVPARRALRVDPSVALRSE